MSAAEQGNHDLPLLGIELDGTEPVLAVPGFDIEAGQSAPAAVEWDPASRNRHLRRVSEGLTTLESTDQARSERQNGHVRINDTLRQKRKVARVLAKACGECFLSDACEIAGDLDGWYEIHRSQDLDGHPGHPALESRDGLQRRIKVDPRAPCIIPQTS